MPEAVKRKPRLSSSPWGNAQFYPRFLLEDPHDSEKSLGAEVAPWREHAVQALAWHLQSCTLLFANPMVALTSPSVEDDAAVIMSSGPSGKLQGT